MEGGCHATRLEGLTHSPPLPATHQTVSGLRELSLERLLSTTIKVDDQRIFQLPARVRACSLPTTHLLH